MRGLKNKVAIVTGGLGDLGGASVVRLREEGCRVVVFDVKPHRAPDYFQVDITDEEQVRAACAQVSGATVLVNCAAAFVFKSVDATAEDWQKILRVNVIGTSLITKHVVPQMKAAGGGSIINFSSVSGFVGQPNFATYNATKFAIRGLTKCWAQDLAPFGIRVNTLCPGYIYTLAFTNSCKALGRDIVAEDRKASAMTLLNRQGKPEEVAA
ncbi:MAG: SDR family oxidoreductase, partial [Verrucomicrobia bacterium]|nr:SDR family oxidoreductase [Verrucomicrobiota bacterium]